VKNRSFGPISFAPFCFLTSSHEIVRKSGVYVYGFLQGNEEHIQSSVPPHDQQKKDTPPCCVTEDSLTVNFFYGFLTLHLSIILVNDQLDAQFFYFIIGLLQSSTCFEQRRAHHQEVELY